MGEKKNLTNTKSVEKDLLTLGVSGEGYPYIGGQWEKGPLTLEVNGSWIPLSLVFGGRRTSLN